MSRSPPLATSSTRCGRWVPHSQRRPHHRSGARSCRRRTAGRRHAEVRGRSTRISSSALACSSTCWLATPPKTCRCSSIPSSPTSSSTSRWSSARQSPPMRPAFLPSATRCRHACRTKSSRCCLTAGSTRCGRRSGTARRRWTSSPATCTSTSFRSACSSRRSSTIPLGCACGRSRSPSHDARVPAWVGTTGRPLIYLTLGTVVAMDEGLRPAIDGLGTLDADVLFALGSAAGTELGSIPGNVRIEPFVNQAALWPAVDLVVHHGGSGTLLGALGARHTPIADAEGRRPVLQRRRDGGDGHGPRAGATAGHAPGGGGAGQDVSSHNIDPPSMRSTTRSPRCRTRPTFSNRSSNSSGDPAPLSRYDNDLPLGRRHRDRLGERSVGVDVDGAMLSLGRRRPLAEIIGTFPAHCRPDRPRGESSTAVRADVPQDGVDTLAAERALERADHRVGRRRRQIGIAVLAVRAEFEGHPSIVANEPRKQHCSAR